MISRSSLSRSSSSRVPGRSLGHPWGYQGGPWKLPGKSLESPRRSLEVIIKGKASPQQVWRNPFFNITPKLAGEHLFLAKQHWKLICGEVPGDPWGYQKGPWEAPSHCKSRTNVTPVHVSVICVGRLGEALLRAPPRQSRSNVTHVHILVISKVSNENSWGALREH